MKKIAAIAVLVISLFAVPAFAAIADLGADVYGCRWQTEYQGSEVSQKGVAYDIIAVIISVSSNPEARSYYGVGTNVSMVGYLRYIDCVNGRWVSVRMMTWDMTGNILSDTGISDTWTWIVCEPNTMMNKVLRQYCGTRS